LLSSPTFPFQVDPGSVTRSAVIVFGLALMASIVAVRRVTRIDPAAAVTSSGLGGLT
jgi:ABC-type antimicrobial peptide transport system permease subunit